MFYVIVLMGVLQGLTEFLPVSSSGHLVLISRIFNVEESLFLSIILHVATLISVIIVLRKEIWQLIRHPFSEQMRLLILATIPTCVIVIILKPIVDSSFGGSFLPICFMISAVLLLITDLMCQNKKEKRVDYKIAILMGIMQGFAVFPGISRSGSTICIGLNAGGSRKDCAKFSFLMSLPIVFLSLLMEVFEIYTNNISISINIPATIISFLVAMFLGIVTIKFMISLTEKIKFRWFSVYLTLISILSFILIY